jgi:hypothetical protein
MKKGTSFLNQVRGSYHLGNRCGKTRQRVIKEWWRWKKTETMGKGIN